MGFSVALFQIMYVVLHVFFSFLAARPELSCEPSNCRVVIGPNDTSLSLKGVLRPAKNGFEIEQARGLWDNGEMISNGTLPQHNNINVTIVGETSETLLLNGPGLNILNEMEFSFAIGFDHGDSECNPNDQLNTQITYTVVVVGEIFVCVCVRACVRICTMLYMSPASVVKQSQN